MAAPTIHLSGAFSAGKTGAEATLHVTVIGPSAVLPLEAHELEFVERINGAGHIVAELLTADPAMQALIQEQPGLKWKAMNVKKRLGVATGGDDF